MATSNAATTYLERRILDYLFKNDSLSFASPGNDLYVGLATAITDVETGTVTEVQVDTDDANYTRKRVVAADWKQSTSTLARGIGTTDTEIQITDAEAFPTSGTIVIDDETITYTGKDGTANADVDGAVSASANVVLDGNNGTITVGMIVTGTGITGTVKVLTVTSQQAIVLDTAVTLADDTLLNFNGVNTLTGCTRGASSTTAVNHVTADVNGAVSASTTVVMDNVFGTLVVGARIRGTGITGPVHVASITSQVGAIAGTATVVLDTAVTISDDVAVTFDAESIVCDQQQVINDNNIEFPAAAGTAATYTVTHAFVADGDIATANVNGATTASKTVVLDGNVGTIAVGDIVTGTGISGSPSGIVRVQTVTSQTNIDLDTAVTLANNAVLTFDGTDKLFVGQLDVSKTIATGDIFRINSGNLSIELK
jgi:ribosomal 30S subunit maturation factor RimM